MNGDGIPDVVTGSYAVGPLASPVMGRIDVLSGADGSTIHTVLGTEPWGLLGEVVLLTGDLDGDGLSEFASSLWGGTVRVYSGADASLFTVIQPPTDWPCSRWFPFDAADVDGDGVPDLVLGCPDASPSGEWGSDFLSGAVAVVSGKTGLPLGAWNGDLDIDRLGRDAAAAGDLDGDGFVDVIGGAPRFYDEDDFLFQGVSYARTWSGATGEILSTFPQEEGATATSKSQRFGWTVDGGGDVDGDGVSDLLVGRARGQPTASVISGQTGELIHGLKGSSGILGATAVWFPGDVDGDGFADVAALSSSGGSISECETWLGPGSYTGCGSLYVYSGAEGELLYRLRPEGSAWGGHHGAPAGDVDGDGFPDFAYDDRSWPHEASFKNGRLTVFSLIPDGVEAIGVGCAPGGGTPPRIGTNTQSFGFYGKKNEPVPVRIHLSQAPAGVPALLLLGASSESWQGVPLPLDLSAAGLPGCELLVSVDAIVPHLTQAELPAPGRATFKLWVPKEAALAGVPLHAQWWVAGPPGEPPSLTRALRIELP